MALFNYATKEITIKVVYYGPGLSGKTTNLQYLHSVFDPAKRGKLLSLATEADRTLFFDFLPVELGKISDFSIRFQLYTVPGQVRYNATRKLVLKGADAVVFVADSQREMKEQNMESMKNMRENLIANNINPDDIPIILQYNKRDIANILSTDELNRDLNEKGIYDFREAIAIDGVGVEETFQRITKLVIKGISEKHKLKMKPPIETPETKEEVLREEAFVKTADQTPLHPVPAVDKSGHASEVEIERYDISDTTKESPHTVVSEETSAPKETIVKEVREIREVPAIPREDLEVILNRMTEITMTLRDLKNIFSDIHSELGNIKREQRETIISIRDITNSIQKLRTKKKWFRLF